ncbi:hypothetical protein EUX98_g8999 [Antrodiella citrinella]|uniref:Glucose-methanol-choline oxidoreductase N-terminal domain-containing protein n=1 Tax=Antrodiella citrinella TaxID=2447956 RepID=A0A4S4M5V8_9APHY|nr:hypothetical protein EUX98_g8999 [Antrodiella citrinella]
MLLSKHDVRGLRRLLTVSLKKGANPRTIVTQLERAIRGVYQPRGGFSTRELEVAYLIKSIGGPRLLYAVQKAYGVPSKSTVSRSITLVRLLPCIGAPTVAEITRAFDTILAPSRFAGISDDPPRRLLGQTFMCDGVSIQEGCRYVPEENSATGFCREHCHNVQANIKIVNLASVQALAKALDDGHVCFGKEATVFAMASQEDGESLYHLVMRILDVYYSHPNGAALHGDIWSWGTDGDSAYRRARYMLCLSVLLDDTTALGRKVRSLVGFNCYVGPRGIVSTSDPKHIIKRFATLARNPRGIQVHTAGIQCHEVLEHLQELPNMSLSNARQLLDPADKQNVPKAVKLMQALMRLRLQPPNPHPSKHHRRQALSFVAEVFGYFTLPFITTDMSLTAQIRSLAIYAHLAAVMFRKHGTSFMTGALYADSQSVVKNIIITVLRLQEIDPTLPFHIILEGTDRLEAIFGDCRTLDHNRNFDILQLAEKLSIALTINSIFERNPDLDRGHRRLNLKDAEGVDHVNPHSWSGDVAVGHVDISEIWKCAQDDANHVLATYFGPSATVDFETIFKGDCDLLRPRPDGKYVGTQFDADDIYTEGPEATSVLATLYPESYGPDSPNTPLPNDDNSDDNSDESPTATAQEDVDVDDSFDDVPEGHDLDQFFPPVDDENLVGVESGDLTASARSEMLQSPTISATGSDDSTYRPVSPTPLTQDSSHPQGSPTHIALHVPDLPFNLPSSESRSAVPEDADYIMIGNRKYLKSSVVAALLSSKRAKKVSLRTLRTRGVTYDDLKSSREDLDNLNSVGLDEDEKIKSGDIAACLACMRGDVCLCVVEILGFKIEGQASLLTAVLVDKLDERPHIQAKVQVVNMEMKTSAEMLEGSSGAFRVTGMSWIWTHEYINFGDQRAKSKTYDTLTPQRCTLMIPGALIHPLAPRITKFRWSSTPDELPSRYTWVIDQPQLEEITTFAWNCLDPETEEIMSNIARIPVIETESLPYQSKNSATTLMLDAPSGEQAQVDRFVIPNLPPLMSGNKLDGKKPVPCLLCGQIELLLAMRNHVGGHILRALRGQSDQSLKHKIGDNPCGFCGLDGCVVQLERTKSGKTYQVLSSCKYHYKNMVYSAASRSSANAPCTNVPIHCDTCKHTQSGRRRTIWKFNALYHVTSEHPTDDENFPIIGKQLLVDMFISSDEERALGIGKERTAKYRMENRLLDSDDYREIAEDVQRAVEEKTKRDRAESDSSVILRRYQNMWPFTTAYPELSPKDLREEYDYVIVGGGTAGCVLANRLSQDPSVSVLLVERGLVQDTWTAQIPLLSSSFSPLAPRYAKQNNVADAALNGRSQDLFSGNSLGGASRVNAMLYTRGLPAEYNLWGEMGREGWSYEELLPLFKRSQMSLAENPSPDAGVNGEWSVTEHVNVFFEHASRLFDAGKRLGLPYISDYNSSTTDASGCTRCFFTVASQGTRESTFTAFLGPSIANARKPHLHVCTGTIALKLDIQTMDGETRAVGVFLKQADGTGASVYVFAKREIVLCSGPLENPRLLQLSGIGPAAHLKSLGIPVLKDLPGVGSHLQDHVAVTSVWQVPLEDSLEKYMQSPLALFMEAIKYFLFGTGLLRSPIPDMCVFANSKYLDAKSHFTGTAEQQDSKNPGNLPDIEILPLPTNGSLSDLMGVDPSQGIFSTLGILLRPRSTGTVLIRSSDPSEPLDIDLNTLSDPADWPIMRSTVRLCAALVKEVRALGYPTTDLCVPADDTDDAIDEHIRKYARTTYHYSSTCRMAPEVAEEGDDGPLGGVVDDELRVWGVKGLRVADTSIFPVIPSAHLQAPAALVAEKCADLIKATW